MTIVRSARTAFGGLADAIGRAPLDRQTIYSTVYMNSPLRPNMSMPPMLTARQQQILEFIRDCVSQRGAPPTRAEIAQHLGFGSLNAAESHLQALARKGAITLEPGRSRGIRLPDEPGLPLVGRVAAGSPLLAVEHIESHWRIDPAHFSPRADYLLRVHGQSMRDAGILDGDLLAVHRCQTAREGQTVVARIDDEVTVKRLETHAGQIRLIACNPDFAPIEVDPTRQSFSIEGIGVGVVRNQLS